MPAALRPEFEELSRQALAEEACQSAFFRQEVARVRQLLAIHVPPVATATPGAAAVAETWQAHGTQQAPALPHAIACC